MFENGFAGECGTASDPATLNGMPRTTPKSQRQYVKNSPAVWMAATLSGGKAGPFSKFIAPALATLPDRPPSGDAWVHEIKFDGYRLQIHLHEGQPVFIRAAGTTGRTGSRPFSARSGSCPSTAPSSMVADGGRRRERGLMYKTTSRNMQRVASRSGSRQSKGKGWGLIDTAKKSVRARLRDIELQQEAKAKRAGRSHGARRAVCLGGTA
jgi:hypothetical protein